MGWRDEASSAVDGIRWIRIPVPSMGTALRAVCVKYDIADDIVITLQFLYAGIANSDPVIPVSGSAWVRLGHIDN
jgi:hypothetical protein